MAVTPRNHWVTLLPGGLCQGRAARTPGDGFVCPPPPISPVPPFHPSLRARPGLRLPCPMHREPQRAQPPSAGTHFCKQLPCTLFFLPCLSPVNMFQLIQFALTLSSVKHSSCQPNIKNKIKKATPAPCWQFGREGSAPASARYGGQEIPLAPQDTAGVCRRPAANNIGAKD